MKHLRGTYYDKPRGRWVGRILFNGVTYRKYCHTELEAHEWYMKKSFELYGFNRFANEGVNI